MKDNNIIIISNNKIFAEKTAAKIILLRDSDSIGIMNYYAAKEKLQFQSPDMLIIHTENEQDINFIQKIKLNESYGKIPILILTERKDDDFLCKAFDAGVNDFADTNTEETVLAMKIMWNLQQKKTINSLAKKNEILSFLEITDKSTDFYLKEYTPKIFEREYQRNLANYNNAVFMILSADNLRKPVLSVDKLAKAVKSILRLDDSAGFAHGEKIYLILKHTNHKKIKKIFERINNTLPFETSISAAAADIKDFENFETAEKILKKYLSKALIEGNSLIYAKNENQKKTEIFNKTDNRESDLKILQKIFSQRIEKTILPAFFKMKSIYEPKLFDTSITNTCDKKSSIYLIKQNNNESKIEIKYKNYNEKIKIEITEIYSSVIEKENIELTVQELTPEKLEDIIQKVSEKFRSKIYESKEEL